MSSWTDKASFCRFLDQAVNNGRLSVIDEIFSPDFIGYFSGADKPIVGPAGCRRWVEELRSAFPDLNSFVEGNWLIAESSAHEVGKGRTADRVAALLVLQGTHSGTYRNIPATGKAIKFVQVHMLTLKDGLIVQDIVVSDSLTLHHQIGSSAVSRATDTPFELPELV